MVAVKWFLHLEAFSFMLDQTFNLLISNHVAHLENFTFYCISFCNFAIAVLLGEKG